MKIQRRTFLKLLSFIGLSIATVKSRADLLKRPVDYFPDRHTLGSYLDTLIPADQTPSASQLGVTEKLLRRAYKSRRYATTLKQGCDWLDQQAQDLQQSNFNLLPPLLQESIVAKAEASAANSLPNRFYTSTRHDAFFYYYAHPKSQTCLNEAGPPQPLGYMDYQKPPKRTTEQCR